MHETCPWQRAHESWCPFWGNYVNACSLSAFTPTWYSIKPADCPSTADSADAADTADSTNTADYSVTAAYLGTADYPGTMDYLSTAASNLPKHRGLPRKDPSAAEYLSTAKDRKMAHMSMSSCCGEYLPSLAMSLLLSELLALV
ncbi:hypothetical protein CONLIGDRAFT_679387 [Coniochaeta ligniaria NRRL 30616]|uniref:Uncharacterized protein n=1 Tax=Coniochaeta ligniaria NRRL 30616 TaxID=1408157 RepID=A0A1J7JL87_9PEZI|nr:hypothetical protein CONLIGDRAFT_679387 [Coniochaeta ligniaria NRRL 30616]